MISKTKKTSKKAIFLLRVLTKKPTITTDKKEGLMVALETPPVMAGWKAPDFRLKGTDGKYYTLNDAKGPKGLVVMFICNHCPFVKAIADKLTRDMKELAALGIHAIASCPTIREPFRTIPSTT